MRKLMLLMVALVLAFGSTACGDDGGEGDDITAGESSTPAATEQTDGMYADPEGDDTGEGNQDIDITDNAFSPSALDVAVGKEVVWENTGQAPHTVTAKTGGFDSGNLAAGEGFSQQFNEAGTVEYSCTIHGFTGTVTVG